MANQVPPFGMDQTNAMDTEMSWGGFWYGRWAGSPNVLTAAGALAPHVPATDVINVGSAAAFTLAAPTAGSQASGGDDFKCICVFSATAFAHTITATGLLQTGSASVNVATFAAFAGANLELMAYNGKWMVVSSVGITFS